MRLRSLFGLKRLADFTSILMIVGGLALFSSLHSSSTTASAAAFTDFPIGVGRTIEFNADDDVADDASPREKLEQMRDWLIFTLISSSGMSAEEATQATFDLPAVRRAYLKPVSRFEFGETRSAFIGNGLVVALIPCCDEKTKSDMLARVVDEHRKNLGEIPKRIAPFEYAINLDEQGGTAYAEVTRRETLDARELFTPEAGYYSKAIANTDDLKDFLSRVDTLTYADARSGLTLGGRKLQGEKYLGVSMEDVAAIWQSEKAGAEKHGSGFSLDPTYDFEGLKKFFDRSIAPMLKACLDEPAVSSLPALPTDRLVPGLFGKRDLETLLSASILSRRDHGIETAGNALGRGDIGPLLSLLDDLSRSNNESVRALAAYNKLAPSKLGPAYLYTIDDKFGFQAARYDGTLQSTSVGMTLFYTDLLAKLWMFDYLHSTPTNLLDDFYSQLEIKEPPIYKEESRRVPNTRLWFGPQDMGYQVARGGKELLLAQTAARVYAAGSDPLKPGIESQASPESSDFLNWWDSHYEEIARFEPQYERLNEIMKWSLLVGWLHREGIDSQFRSLETIQTHHDVFWFPDWVKAQPGLRFTRWGDTCPPGTGPAATRRFSNVRFFQKGYKNSSTEALPLLRSRDVESYGEKGWRLTGGVSLAGRAQFVARPVLEESTSVGQLLRRSNLNYSLTNEGAEALRTIEGASYRFSRLAAERSLVSAAAKDGIALRAKIGDFVGKPTFERILEHTQGGLSLETKAQGLSFGELRIARSGNGFRVGYKSREIDCAQNLARRMSGASNPEHIVASSPRVEAYIRLSGEQGHLVKLKGSDQWLRMGLGNAPEGPGLRLRVADLDPSSRSYALRWMKSEEALSNLGDGEQIVIQTSKEGALRVGTAGKIPDGTVPFEHPINDGVIRGRLKPDTNELFVARRDLPMQVLKDPAQLAKAIQGKANEPVLLDAFRRGEYRSVIKEIAMEPALARGELTRHLEGGFARGADLLKSGRYDEAFIHFNDLIRVHGPRPELLTLRAISRLNQQSPQLATRLAEVMRGLDLSKAGLMGEINARLSTSGLTPRGQSIELVADRGRTSLSYKTQSLPHLAPASPMSINRPAVILIQDSPGLNNLNWHVNTLRSLDEAVKFNVGQLSRVSGLKLGSFRPSMLVVESSPGATVAPALRFRAYYPNYLYQHSKCDGEKRKDGDCEPDVYVFTEGRGR